MGGQGSGRRGHLSSKSTTVDYRALDVRQLQRLGMLKPGQFNGWQWMRNGEKIASIQVQTESDHVILSYRQQSGGEDWKDMKYPVSLEWTDCNYGGQRAWFRCPATGCGRRVAVLYGGVIFACRHCHKLAYESQRENDTDLIARRAEKIRARLGWDAGILNPTGQRPKGMRWQTYWRLCREQGDLTDVALASMIQKLQLSLDLA